MPRSLLTIFLVSWSMLSADAAAQVRHDLPGLNSVGRFFGVGYTLGGYHAGERDGRFDIRRRSAAHSPASHIPAFDLHRLGPQWNAAPCPGCQPAGSQPPLPVDLFHSSPKPAEPQPAEAIRLDAPPTAFHYDHSSAPSPGLDTARSAITASDQLSTPTTRTVDAPPPAVAVKNLYQQASAPPDWRTRY